MRGTKEKTWSGLRGKFLLSIRDAKRDGKPFEGQHNELGNIL